MSVDPLAAVTREPYGYAEQNPLSWGDATGLSSGGVLEYAEGLIETDDEILETAQHVRRDVEAVPPYAGYYASYYAAKGINSVGCSINSIACAGAHVVAAPLGLVQEIDIHIDEFIDREKGESICDEGVVAPINPFHSFLPRALRGPETYLPGFHKNGHVDIEW